MILVFATMPFLHQQEIALWVCKGRQIFCLKSHLIGQYVQLKIFDDVIVVCSILIHP